MSDVKQCKHGRNFCCECHMAEDLKSVREAMKLDNQRIYPAGTSRDLQGELNEAQSQLAALRAELGGYRAANMVLRDEIKTERLRADAAVGDANEAEQRLADAERRNAPEFNIEEAAKMLANCMDYPWEHMPENGRALMRKHAKDVIEAAINPNPEASIHE